MRVVGLLVALLLAFCALTAAPAIAHAQGKKQSVSSLLKKGQELFDEQRYEESIQTLSAALMRPGIDKAEKVDVYKLLAYNYIVLQRDDEADGAVRGLYAQDPDYVLPETESPRFRDFFVKVKEEWEAEGRPGLQVDKPEGPAASKVKIKHASPAQVDAGATISVEGSIDDPEAQVAVVRVFYRQGSDGKFVGVKAKYAMRKFSVDIPAQVVEAPLVEYYVVAFDNGLLPVASRGDADVPLRIAVNDGGGVLTSPWFWVPVSVAVVAAVVIPVVIVTTRSSEATVRVNVFE
ncbi:MAG: hypothetical protein RIF41_28165 [Polyangiaceae bacterium]